MRTAARRTELAPPRHTPTERRLSAAEDGLLALSAVLSVASGVQGARLTRLRSA